MSTRLARNIFIEKSTRIMQYKLAMALGDPPPPNTIGERKRIIEDKHDYYVDELIKEIHKLTDVQKLEAKNSNDVIKLLGQGTITVSEAKDLMAAFHQHMEIEELPKLLEALEKAENETY